MKSFQVLAEEIQLEWSERLCAVILLHKMNASGLGYISITTALPELRLPKFDTFD